jgi:magnesium transporter
VETHRLVEILTAMADDDAADLLADLPNEFREQILGLMSQEDTGEVAELLSYPEDSAGRIMTTDFLALPESMNAQEAVQEVRKASETEMVFYLYVINDDGHLSGVLSLRQLVTAADETRLLNMMTREVVKVHVTTDQEEAARLVSRYNLLAIPVVDDKEALVGIITVDDVIDVLREEATEDILKMAGTSEEEISSFSVWRSVRVRLPWLFAAWIGGVAAIKIIGGFEGQFKEQIALFASLAAFIPIIMGMGGNIGTQSLSITVRGLATGRIDPKLLWKVVFKEIRVGLLLGIVYGALLAAVGWLLNKDFTLGAVVGIAMCGNMALAAVVGTFLPLLAVKFRIDPAVASGPFVTTSIDVLGITLYFLTALLLITR